VIPEVGVLAMVLALLVAAVQGTLPLAGAQRGIANWIALARPAAFAQFGFAALAFGCLASAFISNDFSVRYVALNSHVQLPTVYRFTAAWGGHEGSMLLWYLMFAGWSLAVAAFSRRLPDAFVARVLGVMGWISIGLLVFLLFLSNPFTRLSPPALEGRDLNPLLQDPGMVVHPPLLYMGYVGFSVAFSFGIAALLAGRLDAAWARWSRPWTLAAWAFLTLGITLGSGWAYYVLGWGGWWFWDPVENASFMPWLVGTALIHSLAVTEKRGAFRSWTVLMAIAAFSLSLLGTFLVRSGVLTSVHAFAVAPGRGLYILAFMVAVVGGSLLLFAWRARAMGAQGSFEPLSREGLLLANNLMLCVAALAILLGTLYPLALDVMGGGKISVGPPYFESVFVPLMAPAVFLMGVGPIARWKRVALPELWTRLRWALACGAIAALLPLTWEKWSTLSALGLLLAAWAIASAVLHAWQRIAPREAGARERLRKQPRAWWGMLTAHAGIGLFIIGATLANGHESLREIRLAPGERATVGGYDFVFGGNTAASGPNYDAERATLQVLRDGRAIVTLHPEKRRYRAQGTVLSQADIDVGFTRDLFVALGDAAGEGAWTMRIQVKPFMSWIWVGAALMALGGALAASDRRYRLARAPREDAAAVAASA